MSKISPKLIPLLILSFLFQSCANSPHEIKIKTPRSYTVSKSNSEIVIDGFQTEKAWEQSAWTSEFIDIQGKDFPAPRYQTKVKMLWDDYYLYIFAEMEEPHIWGDITQRDEVIFHNNDFEVFIKPDQNKSVYGEIECNVLNTIWDLKLPKSYRVGGSAIDEWNLSGLKSAVGIRGSVNNPNDIDSGWNVEMAIPIDEILTLIGKESVEIGDIWRINFSRVQWHHEILNNTYKRKVDPQTKKRIAEDNWVWSPQHAIDMHRPEHWGYLQFSDDSIYNQSHVFKLEYETEYQILYNLHRKQIAYKKVNGNYSNKISKLMSEQIFVDKNKYIVSMESKENGYIFSIELVNGNYMRLDSNENIFLPSN